ncbi:elongation factor G-binding protein [Paenibacillus albidus]|uniref:Elongation factor G-binding protein n=1 Tax=Paenibacillus albidus TaxID=2041023 RepID=A0A917CJN7_9BACL|nr:FusB/FusC family EF-G-binding protein [Paenibacillus albidus]GGF88565.1 elongation factor G-binding protein [Paenibacillus albidus]
MCESFIRNHEFNYIKKQADFLLHTLRTTADPKVLESVRLATEAKIAELFPDMTGAVRQQLLQVAGLTTAEDFQEYLKQLEPYLVEFPQVSAKQLQKLFPKNKKLKLPDLSGIDFRWISYLSWNDISTNKLYLVYPLDGQLVGIEGRYMPTNKRNYCFVCNKYKELALFTAISRKRPANASPDYFKSVGNYLCLDGHDCNRSITDLAPLERFIEHVNG